MKSYSILWLWLLLPSNPLLAQGEPAVQAVIQELFDAMRAGDSTRLKAVFYPQATLATVVHTPSGELKIAETSVDRFAEVVGTPHREVYDEHTWAFDMRIDGPLATAWMEYAFYVDTTFSHCGVNAFQLVKAANGWKIRSITDTRRKTACDKTAPDEAARIDSLLNAWHEAASTADEAIFFGNMTETGIYLGTDATERWEKKIFEEWAAPYFRRDTAWSFTPFDRHIYFSEDRQTAWFEEKLDTWMGTCRGSGVLKKEMGTWKIAHYNLAVLVPNEKIDTVIKVIEND